MSPCFVITSLTNAKSFSICSNCSFFAATSNRALTNVIATLLSNTQFPYFFNKVIDELFSRLCTDRLPNEPGRSQNGEGYHLIPYIGQRLFPFQIDPLLRLYLHQFNLFFCVLNYCFANTTSFLYFFLHPFHRLGFGIRDFSLIFYSYSLL